MRFRYCGRITSALREANWQILRKTTSTEGVLTQSWHSQGESRKRSTTVESLRYGRGGAISTPDPLRPRQFPASEENALSSTTYVSSRWRDPVATCSALWNPEALASYNFIYSRFPPTARSGPSSPSRARLSSSSSGCFLGRKGIRDRYREEPFPRTSFGASVREAHFRSTGPRTGKLCGVKGEGNPSNF